VTVPRRLARTGAVLLLVVLIGPALLVPPVHATYAGDRPFSLADGGTVTGDVWYSFGDSAYRGAMQPGESYPVEIPVTLPVGATVRTARLQVFWTWSHDGTNGLLPDLEVSLDGTVLPAGTRHADRKGSGAYDYPFGLDAWNVTGQVRGSGVHRVTVSNAGTGGREVSLYGAALLVVYEDAGMPRCRYWVREGADLLFNTTGVTADQATTSTTFDGVPATGLVRSARLLTVVPGADKGESKSNELFLNGYSLGAVDAPGTAMQVAVNTTDVLPYLREGANTLVVQDRGDCMIPGVFVLTVVEADGPALRPVPPLTVLPRDLDQDGICEDVNGNGRRDFSDIVVYFTSMSWIAENEPVASFDANRNKRIDFNDIVLLFNRL